MVNNLTPPTRPGTVVSRPVATKSKRQGVPSPWKRKSTGTSHHFRLNIKSQSHTKVPCCNEKRRTSCSPLLRILRPTRKEESEERRAKRRGRGVGVESESGISAVYPSPLRSRRAPVKRSGLEGGPRGVPFRHLGGHFAFGRPTLLL